eukprot:sb/3476206/
MVVYLSLYQILNYRIYGQEITFSADGCLGNAIALLQSCKEYVASDSWGQIYKCPTKQFLEQYQEPTETSKRPIRTRYLGHLTSYQPIRDQYFLIRSVPRTIPRAVYADVYMVNLIEFWR